MGGVGGRRTSGQVRKIKLKRGGIAEESNTGMAGGI